MAESINNFITNKNKCISQILLFLFFIFLFLNLNKNHKAIALYTASFTTRLGGHKTLRNIIISQNKVSWYEHSKVKHNSLLLNLPILMAHVRVILRLSVVIQTIKLAINISWFYANKLLKLEPLKIINGP